MASSAPTRSERVLARLASTIRDHKHFAAVLASAPPELRQQIYDVCRPNLTFKAQPLDVYISRAAQRAEAEQLPTVDENGHFRPFSPASDVGSLERVAGDAIAASLAKRTLTLVCSKCTRHGLFYAVGEETNVDVVLKARRDGWIYDPKRDCEICPECPTSLRADG